MQQLRKTPQFKRALRVLQGKHNPPKYLGGVVRLPMPMVEGSKDRDPLGDFAKLISNGPQEVKIDTGRLQFKQQENKT